MSKKRLMLISAIATLTITAIIYVNIESKKQQSVQSPMSFEELVVNLKSDDLETQLQAAKRLGELRDKRAIQPMVNLLKEHQSNIMVGETVGAALAKLGEKENTVETLVSVVESQLFRQGHTPGVNIYHRLSESAVVAIGNLGGQRAAEYLFSKYNAAESISVMAIMFQTLLAKAIEALDVNDILLALKDSSPKVRALAAATLGKKSDNVAFFPLIRLLSVDSSIER